MLWASISHVLNLNIKITGGNCTVGLKNVLTWYEGGHQINNSSEPNKDLKIIIKFQEIVIIVYYIDCDKIF